MVDVSPAILKKVTDRFNELYRKNTSITVMLRQISRGTATYDTANRYAITVGEMLRTAFREITQADLPNGRMYYNIAQKVLMPPIQNNYNLIAAVTAQIQRQMNEAAGLQLDAVIPPINTSRVEGFVRKVSDAEYFDDARWMLQEPVINYSQSVVDEFIQENARFQYEAGLNPKITRYVVNGCCSWCRAMAGTYDYADAPDDIYRQHEFCRCTREFISSDGKRTILANRKDPREEKELIARRTYGL